MNVSSSTRPTLSHRPSAERHTPLGRHAIVIGGSVAGLTAARVLADYFESVTICERDRFPNYAQHRPGVPQSPHLHGLLARGLEIVEELFPGIRKALIASGAVELEAGTDFAWLLRAGWGVRYSNGAKLLSFTRPLIDWHLRERVRGISNVKIIDTCDVLGLIQGPGGRVAGVRARLRAAATRSAIDLDADLVVDASGRRSRAPEWLADLGAGALEETTIDASIGYASRVYRRPKGHSATGRRYSSKSRHRSTRGEP